MNLSKNLLQKLEGDKITAVLAGVLVVVAGFFLYNKFTHPNDNGKITEQALTQEAGSEINQNNNEIISVTEKQWVANDYKKGDIPQSSYTVVEGDTLWEIAEAHYGDGFGWKKILEANNPKIGWLENGNPLITPGQILILPD